MRRNQLVWGIILLLLGGLMLANAMGIKLPNGTSLIELFWPFLLILGGISVLVGVYFRGSAEVENASIDLLGASSVDLNISHGAGELKIHSGANANEIVRGSFAGGLNRKINRNGDSLDVRLRPARDFMEFPFFGPGTQLDWDISLNAQVPIALKLNLGANTTVLDLHDLKIKNLDLDTGASDTKIILPEQGRFNVDLDLGAASLEVTIPKGVSGRIRASLGAVEMKIDQIRFPRNANYYQSPDYDTAVNAVDMTIDAGAASIIVK